MFLALVLVTSLFGAAGSAFWFQEIRYLLPTPRPEALGKVEVGTPVPLSLLIPGVVTAEKADSRPFFLHFFNADCPCSRFNADHLIALYRAHGQQARFIAVVQATGDPDKVEAIRIKAQRTFGGMPVVIDLAGRIAEACGVYSTPQAALFSPSGSLLYRGNYNVARFCEDRQSEFARIALEAAIAGQPQPAMPAAATTSYGCELPSFAQRSTEVPSL